MDKALLKKILIIIPIAIILDIFVVILFLMKKEESNDEKYIETIKPQIEAIVIPEAKQIFTNPTIDYDYVRVEEVNGKKSNYVSLHIRADEDSSISTKVDLLHNKVYFGYCESSDEIEQEIISLLNIPEDKILYRSDIYVVADYEAYYADGTDSGREHSIIDLFTVDELQDPVKTAQKIVMGETDYSVRLSIDNYFETEESVNKMLESYPGVGRISGESYSGNTESDIFLTADISAYRNDNGLVFDCEYYKTIDENGIFINYCYSRNYYGDNESFTKPEIVIDKKKISVYTDSPEYYLYSKSLDAFPSDDAYYYTNVYKDGELEEQKTKLELKLYDNLDVYILKEKDRNYYTSFRKNLEVYF